MVPHDETNLCVSGKRSDPSSEYDKIVFDVYNMISFRFTVGGD